MKNSEMLLLAGAALALFLVMRSRQAGAGASRPSSYSEAINNPSKPGDAAYGWQYFTGGTVIDPDGAYWRDGRIVWAPGLDASW